MQALPVVFKGSHLCSWLRSSLALLAMYRHGRLAPHVVSPLPRNRSCGTGYQRLIQDRHFD